MYILLMRHGDAVDKSVDESRPLSETGITQVNRVAEYLGLQFPEIKLCCHSQKLRTKQTAEIIHDMLEIREPLQYFPALDPDENALRFTDQLQEFAQNTLFVGHLPNIHLFLNNLLMPHHQAIANMIFEPATVVVLNHNQENHWEMISKFNPSEPEFD